VVPRLSTFTTPPISSDGIGGTFTISPRRTAPIYVPDSQYAYLEQVRTHPSPKFQRVSIFFLSNKKFKIRMIFI